MPLRLRDHSAERGPGWGRRAADAVGSLRRTVARLVAAGERYQRDTEATEKS